MSVSSFFAYITVLLTLFLASPVMAFSPEYSLQNNILVRLADENRITQTFDKIQRIKVHGADFIAYPVSKDVHEGMDGSISGVYFFNEDGSFNFFVKFDDPGAVSFTYDIYFSTDGKYAVFDSGTSPERALSFYDLQSMQEIFKTVALGPFEWVDGERFVMTLMEDNVFARDGVQYGSGEQASVALYSTAQKKLIYIKKCTAVADYFIHSIDATAKTVNIREMLVPSPKDWSDYNKYKESVLRNISLP